MKQKMFALLPGDRRQAALCALLEDAGCTVQLLPPPEQWGRENLPPPGTVIPVANATAALRDRCAALGFRLLEYGRRPDFMAENGAVTAENALRVAMEEGRLLRGSRALVIGWGNIGKPLALLLRAAGADTAVSARRGAHRAQIAALGLRPARTDALEALLPTRDLVFNTVPAPVLGRAQLELLPPEAAVIDLASAPGGVDLDAARECGRRALPALALPGRMTPRPAAEAILHAVCAALEEDPDGA